MRKRKKLRNKDFYATKATLIGAIALTTVTGAYLSVGLLANNLATNLTTQLTAQPQQEPPQQDTTTTLVGQTTPSVTFLTIMGEHKPANTTITGTKDETTSLPTAWVCPNITLTPHPTGGIQTTTPNATITTQTFGAGQTGAVLNQYKQGIPTCRGINGRAYTLTQTPLGVDGAQGFAYNIALGNKTTTVNVWARGDAIMTVQSKTRSTVESLTKDYDKAALNGLQATQCLSQDTPATTDAQRSPYYNNDKYTGWEKGRTVKLTKTAPRTALGYRATGTETVGEGVTLGVVNDDLNPENTGTITANLTHLTASKPLPPLPEGVPDSLPVKQDRPAQPVVTEPSKPATKTTIPERVEDPQGPGCGWVWGGQNPPQFDATAEKAAADKKAAETRRELAAAYDQWMNDRNNWFNLTLDYNKDITQWERSVKKYNTVAAQWQEVNSIRAAYRAQLDAYYTALDEYETFLDKQTEAQKGYDAAMKKCEAQREEIELTNDPAPNPTGSPTPPPANPTDTPTPPTANPTDIPTPPGDNNEGGIDDSDAPQGEEEPQEPKDPCDKVKRPTILDQKPPLKPAPPAKPSIPLPSSWSDVP